MRAADGGGKPPQKKRKAPRRTGKTAKAGGGGNAIKGRSVGSTSLVKSAEPNRSANGTGRPTILTAELAEAIVMLVAAGNYMHVAAGAVGVDSNSLRRWMKLGRADINAGRTKTVAAFFTMNMEKAVREAEASQVVNIGLSARFNWQASAWLLERKHPERWGRPWGPGAGSAGAGGSGLPPLEKDAALAGAIAELRAEGVLPKTAEEEVTDADREDPATPEERD